MSRLVAVGELPNFAQVIQRRAPYFGPLPTGSRVNEAFAEAFGGIEGAILVMPVILGNRIPLIVFASDASHTMDPDTMTALTDAAREAFGRLLVQRKTDGPPA